MKSKVGIRIERETFTIILIFTHIHQIGSADYNIGSLSLLAHQPLPGYEALPDFPQEQPDVSVRNVEELEGWSGSRTVVMESGFGSDSFENKYRGSRSGASTALSGIEAMGNSFMYSPSSSTYKKKGNDYDLDAFYDESSEEEESSSAEEETSTEEEDDTEEEEGDSEEGSEEEETDSETDSDEESSEDDTSNEEEEQAPIKPLRRK